MKNLQVDGYLNKVCMPDSLGLTSCEDIYVMCVYIDAICTKREIEKGSVKT